MEFRYCQQEQWLAPRPIALNLFRLRCFIGSYRSPVLQIVDVRAPEEYASGHIGGAININVNSDDFVEKAIAALKKSEPVYVYCRSGKRSLKAADLLAKAGYSIVNLDNGILGWEKDGFSVVKD